MSLTVLCFLLLLIPSLSRAETVNVGFVQGLWYSKEPVFVGIPTRVYVAFRNNTDGDLTGTVVFMDNGKRIGTSDVNVLSGRIAEAWTDWTPGEGEHQVTVTLTNALLHAVGGEPEEIDVTGIAAEDAIIVDRDSDVDNVGNAKDEDDDGDGISDEDEKRRGTDPLKADTKPVAATTTAPAPTPSLPTPPTKERGLEQFLPEGRTDTLISGITDSVESAKIALDAYRDERTNALRSNLSTSSFDNATITRSREEGNGTILGTIVGALASVMKYAYTLVLFLLSSALAFPALIELFLLIGLLYALYRIARRFGRRPGF